MKKCRYDGETHLPVKGHSTIVYCAKCGDILKGANEKPPKALINLCMDEFMMGEVEVRQIINDEDGEFE